MCDEDTESKKNSSSESISNCQAIPEADREIAGIAFQEFEEKRYEQCLKTLRRLFYKRPQDIKVLHNICVTEYYLSNCKNTEILARNIKDICKKAHINIEDTDAFEDVDNCIIAYNQAVLLYHLHQYNASLNILNRLSQFLEPLEESLAKNVGFLLLDVYLNVYQPKIIGQFSQFFETTYFMNNKSGKINQKEGQKDDNEDIVNDQQKRRFQICKARLFAQLKTSKACKREIKNLMVTGTGTQNIIAFYLKSQLDYQRGNYRKALKLLHSATMPEDFKKYFEETGDCLPVTFYNNVGCIHFYMGKPQLGIFYINKALEELDKYLLAVSDKERLSDNILNSRPLHLLSLSTYHILIYNLGMQCMQARNFSEAFQCFIEVIKSYPSNPRLWLRLAECCIQIHKPDNVNQFIECKKKPFIKAIISAGRHRKLILNSSIIDKTSEVIKLDTNEITPNLHFAMLCLKNARSLLPENLSNPPYVVFLPSIPVGSDDMGTNHAEENFMLPVQPSATLTGVEVISLRNSILVASSYVALCLGDIILAHEYAKLLLSQPRISAAHKFLAHLYAGEALLLMDRITEAVEHFNFQHNNNIELATPANSSEVSLKHQMRFDSKLTEKNDDGSRPVGNMPNWLPNSISSAKFVSQYNLAVAYAVREEWSKASECLLQLSTNGNVPPQAVSLLLYIQCHQGTADETKVYVKQSLAKVT